MKISRLGIWGTDLAAEVLTFQAITNGLKVLLVDTDQHKLKHSLTRIGSRLDRYVAEAQLSPEQKLTMMDQIQLAFDPKALAEVDAVVEASHGEAARKKEAIHRLDQVLAPHVVLVVLVSYHSLNDLVAQTQYPERCVGLHLTAPLVYLTQVEIVSSLQTSLPTVEMVQKMIDRMGVKSVSTSDRPGLVYDRIVLSAINQAIGLVDHSKASVSEVDQLVTVGSKPYGILELADLMGLDDLLKQLEYLYDQTKEPQYVPHSLLVNKVHQGFLGRKTNKGFYDY